MPLTYFPQINANGIRVQRPYSTEAAFKHVTNEMESGPRYSFSYRTNPLSRFTLNFPSLIDDEVAVLETFFIAQNGKFGQWVYLDPYGNLVQDSESVTGTSDPFGGIRAGTSGSLSQSVLVSDGDGIVLCTSIWVNGSTGDSYTLGITGDTGTVTIPQDGWNRIQHTGVVSGAGAISATFTGTATTVFGFSCVALPAAGGYSHSAGPGSPGYGLHTCRFDSDSFPVRYIGPNETSVSLTVVEVGF
jgi:hypothetical protein